MDVSDGIWNRSIYDDPSFHGFEDDVHFPPNPYSNLSAILDFDTEEEDDIEVYVSQAGTPPPGSPAGLLTA